MKKATEAVCTASAAPRPNAGSSQSVRRGKDLSHGHRCSGFQQGLPGAAAHDAVGAEAAGSLEGPNRGGTAAPEDAVKTLGIVPQVMIILNKTYGFTGEGALVAPQANAKMLSFGAVQN